MKNFVLFLMLFVLVVSSQKFGDNKPQVVNPLLWRYFSPRLLTYHPSFFYESNRAVTNEVIPDAKLYDFYFKESNSDILENYSNNDGLYLMESRTSGRMRPSSQQGLPTQQRFFLNLLNSNGNNGWFSWLRPQPATASFVNPVTVTINVPMTLTTAVVSSCIPLAQFAAGSTTPCSRKKRSSQKDLFAYEFDLQSGPLTLSPSRVDKVQPTLLPASISDIRKDERLYLLTSPPEKEIASSKVDDVSSGEDTLSHTSPRKYRQLTNFVHTATSTQYFFTSTVIKKTVSLVIPGAAGAANQQLACLPAGFQLC